MKETLKDDVYRETLGLPDYNEKELRKENDRLLSSETKKNEKEEIIYRKISRIEKMCYAVLTILIILFAWVIFGI